MPEQFFIQVAASEGNTDDEIELPVNADGYLPLETLRAQFSAAVALSYKNEEGTWTKVGVDGSVLKPPEGGWTDRRYYVKASLKRKLAEEVPSDIIVINLPRLTRDKDLREYFSKFGELARAEVKEDPETKQPKGFGFIRYKSKEVEVEVLKTRWHVILNQDCKIDISNKDLEARSVKLFIGHLPECATQEDVHEHFSKFGIVTDVYIPTPFKSFGFVTFEDKDDAARAIKVEHNIMGSLVNLKPANGKRDKRILREEARCGRRPMYTHEGDYTGYQERVWEEKKLQRQFYAQQYYAGLTNPYGVRQKKIDSGLYDDVCSNNPV